MPTESRQLYRSYEIKKLDYESPSTGMRLCRYLVLSSCHQDHAVNPSMTKNSMNAQYKMQCNQNPRFLYAYSIALAAGRRAIVIVQPYSRDHFSP
jgi:hypothetical protein